MIKYQLQCDDGHGFEGWFPSSDAFEKQKKRGLVTCAVCGINKVDRAIMAPSVARTDQLPVSVSQDWMTEAPMSLMSDEERALRQRLAELRREMIKDADDVGERFRRAGGSNDTEPVDHFIAGHTGLGDGRHLGQGAGALVAGHGQAAQLAGAHLRNQRHRAGNGHADLAGNQIGDQRARAFVGNVVHLHAGHRLEQFHRQMA